MKRAIYLLANLLGGVVLVLLLIDPGRPLGPSSSFWASPWSVPSCPDTCADGLPRRAATATPCPEPATVEGDEGAGA
jgi:hypothetical protein